MASHLRSTSLPSRAHSSEPEVEDEMRSLEASISSPSTTIDTMRDGLGRLGDIYNGVEEIICLPSSSQQRRTLEGEMEHSLKLLDLCSAMQATFVELKAAIQELQVALRRGDDVAAQAKILAYTRLAKKAKKQIKNIITKKDLTDKTDSRMVRLLVKARRITVSLMESTIHLLSKQIEMPKQSLVSKALHKRRAVVCEEQQLQVLECGIGDLENGAGHLLRKLVQSRVSILNILSL